MFVAIFSCTLCRGIDFSADVGEFVCLLGPSGCGTSITTGSVLIGGQDMTRAKIDTWVAEAARMLDITPLLDRKPRQLSGGQRQRVAIGRAIVRDPAVFRFDEPLSNLDAALRTQTRYELARLHKQLGRTMLFVTHDQIEAMNAGRVAQIGRPMELYERPANRFVAGFIGSPQMNFLPASMGQTAGTVEVAGQTLPLPPGADASQVAEVGLRPEHLRPEHLLNVAPGSPGISARVTAIERLGAETLVFAKTAGQTLVLRAEGSLKVQDDDAITLAIDPARLHLFDRHGARCFDIAGPT